jgi:glycosyltransferase involved in cell wall biosynthesis
VISIIIPHFERVDLLRETLNSLHRQTINDWEAIIVDDGSAEETKRAVEKLATERIRVLHRTDGPRGPSRCRNIGLQAALGKYIVFLDSDDLLAENCLQQRLLATTNFPDYDFWTFPVELFIHEPGDLGQPWNVEAGDPLRRFLASDGPWCVSSAIWRKGSLMQIGGFNEAVMYGDDENLHIRALLHPLKPKLMEGVCRDVYIRRSSAPRITKGAAEWLLNSRLVRLTEGRRCIASSDNSHELLDLWEGQYFAEGEFILFNSKQPQKHLSCLFRLWRSHETKRQVQRHLAHGYFLLMPFFISRCYLILRISRRLAMLLLPQHWFPHHRRR